MPGSFTRDYREYAPSSASGLDTMPDQHFQSPLDYSNEGAIDPRLEDGSQALAGVGVDHQDVPFGDMGLDDASNFVGNYDLRGIPQPDHLFNLPSESETAPRAWLHGNTMKRSHEDQHYATPERRKVPRSDYGTSTPLRSGYTTSPGTASQAYGSQYSPGVNQYPNPPTSAYVPQDIPDYQHPMMNAFESQQPGSVIPVETQSQRQPQQAPDSGNTKGSRTKKKIHQCHHCVGGKLFSTVNDLDRHKKSVHGRVDPGDKIWLCRVPGCSVSTKIWVRLDNFKQHIHRIHGNEHTDSAEGMQTTYDPATHGPIEPSKGKKGGSQQAHQHSVSQDASDPSAIEGMDFDYTETFIQPHEMAQREPSLRRARTQSQALMSISQTPNTGSTSMINHGQRSSSLTSNAAQNKFLTVAPQHQGTYQNFAQNVRSSGPMNKPRTVADPRTLIQERRLEMQQQQRLDLSAVPSTPTTDDLTSIGAGLGTSAANSSMPQDEGGDQEIPREVQSSIAKATELFQNAMRAFGDVPAGLRDTLISSLSSSGQKAARPPASRSAKSSKTSEAAKSDGLKVVMTCTEHGCDAKFSKKSELNKHISRHLRKYGCTFDHCYKRFGTKWEWKRHEHNQHVQLDEWRCRQQDCDEPSDDRNAFITHLKQHRLRDVETELAQCALAKKWLGSFWCGFCSRIIPSEAEFGAPMDEERYNHISRHIDGPEKRNIDDWIELKGRGKTKSKQKDFDREGDLKELRKGNNSKGEKTIEDSDESSELDDEDEDDAPGEADDSPIGMQALTVDTSFQPSRESPGYGDERRRYSTTTVPAVIVSPAEVESNVQRTFTDMRPRSISDGGHGTYTIMVRKCCQCKRVSQYSPQVDLCPGCYDPYCHNCEQGSIQQRVSSPQRLQPPPMFQPGYSTSVDESGDMYGPNSF